MGHSKCDVCVSVSVHVCLYTFITEGRWKRFHLDAENDAKIVRIY